MFRAFMSFFSKPAPKNYLDDALIRGVANQFLDENTKIKFIQESFAKADNVKLLEIRLCDIEGKETKKIGERYIELPHDGEGNSGDFSIETNSLAINYRSSRNSWTILQIAATYNYLEVAKYAVAQGAQICIRDRSALCLAARNDHPKMLDYLIQQKADINHEDHDPLFDAVKSCSLDCVKILLENKSIQLSEKRLNKFINDAESMLALLKKGNISSINNAFSSGFLPEPKEVVVTAKFIQSKTKNINAIIKILKDRQKEHSVDDEPASSAHKVSLILRFNFQMQH